MKIIVDTNIVFSAILNSSSRIGKILLRPKGYFQFYSCNYLKTKILRHRIKLLKLTKLSLDELTELEELVTHIITFIDERLLPRELLLKVENLLKAIDPSHTPFVALAKHLEGKLWTGDMQLYNGLKARRIKNVITTAELDILLDDLERE